MKIDFIGEKNISHIIREFENITIENLKKIKYKQFFHIYVDMTMIRNIHKEKCFDRAWEAADYLFKSFYSYYKIIMNNRIMVWTEKIEDWILPLNDILHSIYKQFRQHHLKKI